MKWRTRLALAFVVLAPTFPEDVARTGEPSRSVLHAQETKLLRYYYSPWGSMCIGPCPDVRPVLCCQVGVPE
jgi:hypothetical protein